MMLYLLFRSKCTVARFYLWYHGCFMHPNFFLPNLILRFGSSWTVYMKGCVEVWNEVCFTIRCESKFSKDWTNFVAMAMSFKVTFDLTKRSSNVSNSLCITTIGPVSPWSSDCGICLKPLKDWSPPESSLWWVVVAPLQLSRVQKMLSYRCYRKKKNWWTYDHQRQIPQNCSFLISLKMWRDEAKWKQTVLRKHWIWKICKGKNWTLFMEYGNKLWYKTSKAAQTKTGIGLKK